MGELKHLLFHYQLGDEVKNIFATISYNHDVVLHDIKLFDLFRAYGY